jgi:hypothetical protein
MSGKGTKRSGSATKDKGSRKSARNAKPNDPPDSDDDTTVSPTDHMLEENERLKKENFRLKKREKYSLQFKKKGPKNDDKPSAMQREVQKRTKTDLWPVMKFIGSEEKLISATIFVMKRINPRELDKMEDGYEKIDKEEEWIAEYKGDVRIGLNNQRNYVQQELRELYHKLHESGDEACLPNVRQILQLLERKGLQKGDNKARMEAFFDKYWDALLPKVAGHANWPPTRRHYLLLSTAETKSKNVALDPLPCVDHTTEAFLVAIWENCLPRWKYECLQKRNKEDVDPEHADMAGLGYTTSNSGRQQFGGWSPVGKARVKLLGKMAKKARVLDHVKAVEEAALERIRHVFGSNWYPLVAFLYLH